LSKLDDDLREWTGCVVEEVDKSGYSGINAVERILRDPGFSTGGSQHRILWWPKNRRMAKMSRAMHRIDSISRICLIVEYGPLKKSDDTAFTVRDLKLNSSLSIGEIRERIRDAKSALRDILRGAQ
jgi:hypothetical protein